MDAPDREDRRHRRNRRGRPGRRDCWIRRVSAKRRSRAEKECAKLAGALGRNAARRDAGKSSRAARRRENGSPGGGSRRTQTGPLYPGGRDCREGREELTFQIDHLGIAVKSLAAAKAIYEKLGLTVSPEETVEQEQVRLVMVPVGESRLELLEATSANSTIAKFIAKRGEGLHHVCLKVPDLPAAVERLKKDGVRLVSEEIKVGAGGHKYVFVHPSSTGGVLLELVQG